MSDSMETIQGVLDRKLLRAVDDAAKQAGINRSALIRQAVCEHLRRLHVQGLEAQDRSGYLHRPSHKAELEAWESVAEWPEI